MTATAAYPMPASTGRTGGPAKVLTGLIDSFGWALKVRRRCDREIAAGRPLDGATIRRIVAEVDGRITTR